MLKEKPRAITHPFERSDLARRTVLLSDPLFLAIQGLGKKISVPNVRNCQIGYENRQVRACVSNFLLASLTRDRTDAGEAAALDALPGTTPPNTLPLRIGSSRRSYQSVLP